MSTSRSVPSTSMAASICSIVDMPVERMIGLPVSRSASSSSMSVSARRRDLVRDDAEVLEERDARHVPRRREPLEPAQQRVVADLDVLVAAELDAVAVLEVGHRAPRRLARHVAHVLGRGDLGRALLELHRVRAGVGRDVDEPLGELDVAVVVEADLGDDIGGAAAADDAGSDRDGHVLCPSVRSRWRARGRGCDAGVLARAEHAVGEVAHRAVAAGAADDHARGGEHERVRVGHRDRPADELEAARGR